MIARNDFISIYGLWLWDPTLFDDFVIPVGMDKDDLLDNLVMECAELEVLYPDAAFMKQALKSWSRKQLPAWTKLFQTESFTYNPIWNKDGEIVEEFDETRKGLSSVKNTGTENVTGAGTAEREVSAFNESGYHPSEMTTTSTQDGTTTNNDTSGSTDETIHHKNTRKETGNIGVTTTQQMIREEREVDRFLTQDVIIAEFKRRFCLLVY